MWRITFITGHACICLETTSLSLVSIWSRALTFRVHPVPGNVASYAKMVRFWCNYMRYLIVKDLFHWLMTTRTAKTSNISACIVLTLYVTECRIDRVTTAVNAMNWSTHTCIKTHNAVRPNSPTVRMDAMLHVREIVAFQCPPSLDNTVNNSKIAKHSLKLCSLLDCRFISTSL